VNDQKLEDEIKQWLDEDDRLAHYGLNAKADKGHVTLQGIVDVLAEKEYAGERLLEFPGVRSLDNALVICTDGGIDDKDVAFEVAEELHADPYIPDSIGAQVHGGNVRLLGKVESLAQEEAAFNAAKKARGVIGVTSEIQMEDTPGDDGTLANRVKTALIHDPQIPGRRIGLICRKGAVYLVGRVENEDVLREIRRVVSHVSGVRSVHLNMEVVPETPGELVAELLGRIAGNPYLNQEGIEYTWEHNQIAIEGMVDSNEAKKALEREVRHLLRSYPGKIYMDNRIRVEPQPH
jgi:hyperosmotically inducible protein